MSEDRTFLVDEVPEIKELRESIQEFQRQWEEFSTFEEEAAALTELSAAISKLKTGSKRRVLGYFSNFLGSKRKEWDSMLLTCKILEHLTILRKQP